MIDSCLSVPNLFIQVPESKLARERNSSKQQILLEIDDSVFRNSEVFIVVNVDNVVPCKVVKRLF